MLLPAYAKVKTLTLTRLCCYFNSTYKMQLIRVSDNGKKLERVVSLGARREGREAYAKRYPLGNPLGLVL